jgi:YVTN family beta-propeller protein
VACHLLANSGRRFAGLCCAVLALTAGASHAAPFAYITNKDSANVSVIDTATDTVIATVPVGAQPWGVAVNPVRPRVYVANNGSGSVSVIDTTTQTVVATIPVGPLPTGVAVRPDGTRIYVTDLFGSFSVIDADTNTQIGSVPLQTPASNSHGITIHPDGSFALVAHAGTNTFSKIDLDNPGINSPFPAGGLSPFDIAMYPGGVRAYMTFTGSCNVIAIGLGLPGGTVPLVPVGDPCTIAGLSYGIAVNPVTGLVYVATPNGVRRIANLTAFTFSPFPATGVGVHPNGQRVYAADSGTNTVKVLDADLGTVLATIPVGTNPQPFGIFVSPITAPLAPIIGTATPGNSEATIAFTAASDGGSPITGYTATCNPGAISATGAASPLLVTGLANGTAYACSVTAANAIGTSVASATVNVTPATVPGAPAIGIFASGDAQATVTITAPASDGGSAITGYTVVSNPAGGIDGDAGTLTTPRVVTGLTNGTAYTFTVTATNAIGTSVASAPSSSVTPAGPPAAPTGTAATAGNAQAAVTFVAPVSNGGSAITGYTVTSNPAGGIDGNAGTTSTNHIVTGLANGTAYTFTVTATNAIGTSTPSASSNSVTPSAPPGAPGAPTAAAATAGNAQATVTFTAPVSNGGSAITGYTVTSNPAGGVDGNAGTTSTSHVVTGLTNGTIYVFTVTATNAIGTSAPSAASNSVRPVGPPGAPTIGVAAPGNGQATISFTPPVSDGGSAILSYAATCNPGAISASGTASPLTVAGLANGTQYACSVAATNSAGAGSASATTTVTPTHNVFSGPSATGSGTATVSFSGGGAACTFAPAGNGPLQSAFFIPVSGHPKSPPAGTAPGAVAFPHGLLDFVLLNCTPGATVSFTVTYPAALPAAVQYWKYGPTPASATPHWYVLPATITGNSVTFSIVDGGLGDDDLAANGTVVDQGGPGAPGAGGEIRQVPTLSEWALVLLASLMLLGAARPESLGRG